MDTDGSHLDSDDEFFEDSRERTAPAQLANLPVEAMLREKAVPPLLDRFEPRYRPIASHSHGHQKALTVIALLLVTFVATAGWYLGSQPAGNGQASQVVQTEKQNKVQ